jgi:2-oxoisovalerate dehydrogenase E2 component (dihydrolipoyl transacylase)
MVERIFALPDLGEGLEEGTVSAWLVAEGDTVDLNQPIAEIETAKAVVEMPSPFAGRIVRFHVPAGSEARVGEPLITFDVEGSAASGVEEPSRQSAPPTASVAGPGPPGRHPTSPESRVSATPAIRRLAKDLGVDLPSVTPSGPAGRVTREDVERSAASASDDTVEEVTVSPMRRAIAARLVEIASIPQVTTFRTVDCTALDEIRRGVGGSPLPIVVRALAEIRGDHPLLNASWGDERILVHRDVNVGIATDTERGLVVPVVKGVGSLRIGEIADEIRRLADAARAGSLKPGEATGATIAVSNTGSYGSEAGTPLLNPGHAVTVAFGVMEPRALVVNGSVEARLAATISLTFDHRVLDGATVGRGLTALVELLGSRERLDALPR